MSENSAVPRREYRVVAKDVFKNGLARTEGWRGGAGVAEPGVAGVGTLFPRFEPGVTQGATFFVGWVVGVGERGHVSGVENRAKDLSKM